MNSRKRTTVRLDRLPSSWAHLCRVLAALSPPWAVRLAVWLFLRPPTRRKPRMREQLVLAAGQRLELGFQTTTLSAWRWGRGPVVLLVHDWGSSAGQLQAFVQPLVRGGFTVVAFDAPGHGVSGGTWSSLTRLSAAIEHVAQTVGPLHAVIAHALGAAATELAIERGLQLARLVEISPSASAQTRFERHASALHLGDTLTPIVRGTLERRLGVGLDTFDPDRLASAVQDVPMLVIHDRLDREVPFAQAARRIQSLHRGRLMSTLGLGHHDLVADPLVIDAARRFIDRDRPPARANAPIFGALRADALGISA